jgi:hypothetical protein
LDPGDEESDENSTVQARTCSEPLSFSYISGDVGLQSYDEVFDDAYPDEERACDDGKEADDEERAL